jgi:hypothetical protein
MSGLENMGALTFQNLMSLRGLLTGFHIVFFLDKNVVCAGHVVLPSYAVSRPVTCCVTHREQEHNSLLIYIHVSLRYRW